MKKSLFAGAIEAGARQDADAIRALHRDDFLSVWETEMAQLDEHLEWVAKDIAINPNITGVECLFDY